MLKEAPKSGKRKGIAKKERNYGEMVRKMREAPEGRKAGESLSGGGGKSAASRDGSV